MGPGSTKHAEPAKAQAPPFSRIGCARLSGDGWTVPHGPVPEADQGPKGNAGVLAMRFDDRPVAVIDMAGGHGGTVPSPLHDRDLSTRSARVATLCRTASTALGMSGLPLLKLQAAPRLGAEPGRPPAAGLELERGERTRGRQHKRCCQGQ